MFSDKSLRIQDRRQKQLSPRAKTFQYLPKMWSENISSPARDGRFFFGLPETASILLTAGCFYAISLKIEIFYKNRMKKYRNKFKELIDKWGKMCLHES
jgi:hypothetical protein